MCLEKGMKKSNAAMEKRNAFRRKGEISPNPHMTTINVPLQINVVAKRSNSAWVFFVKRACITLVRR
jgi:hypothetical protein